MNDNSEKKLFKDFFDSFCFNLDVLVYTSHKSASSTIDKTFDVSNVKSFKIHSIKNILYTKSQFLTFLEEYKDKNNNKLKIVTCLRNPIKRLKSSFFQKYHDREIRLFNKSSNETTIMLNDIDSLINLYKSIIFNNDLPSNESLLELKEIFDINFDTDFVLNENYLYYENNLIKLYILKFDNIISNHKINYLKNIFKQDLIEVNSNLTSEKLYFEKYNQFNKIDLPELDEFIHQKYKIIFDLLDLMK